MKILIVLSLSLLFVMSSFAQDSNKNQAKVDKELQEYEVRIGKKLTKEEREKLTKYINLRISREGHPGDCENCESKKSQFKISPAMRDHLSKMGKNLNHRNSKLPGYSTYTPDSDFIGGGFPQSTMLFSKNNCAQETQEVAEASVQFHKDMRTMIHVRNNKVEQDKDFQATYNTYKAVQRKHFECINKRHADYKGLILDLEEKLKNCKADNLNCKNNLEQVKTYVNESSSEVDTLEQIGDFLKKSGSTAE